MVNADAYRDIGSAYGVGGYPTIKYFAGQGLDKVGKEYDGGEVRAVDARGKHEYLRSVRSQRGQRGGVSMDRMGSMGSG